MAPGNRVQIPIWFNMLACPAWIGSREKPMKNNITRFTFVLILMASLSVAADAAKVDSVVDESVVDESAVDESAVDESVVDSVEVLSQVYRLDALYKSMRGPQSTQEVRLLDAEVPELLWITGYKAVMVEEDGVTQLPQEFMCHSNLDIDIERHQQIFSWSKSASNRLFTLSQGQYEIHLPEGYGIPILSNEVLYLTTQVLNHNHPLIDQTIRHKVTINFIRDKNTSGSMKALFMTSANGLVSLEDPHAHYGFDPAEKIPAEIEANQLGKRAGGMVRTDNYGQKFAGFWVVPPGRQETTTLVTKWMDLPFDTDVHYIAAHVHPFAQSLELQDLTMNQTVYKAGVISSVDKVGVDQVDFFSTTASTAAGDVAKTAETGLRLFQDHQYQLVTVYDNPTKSNRDSMAVLYLYVRDLEFRNPLTDNNNQQVLEPRDSSSPMPGADY